MLHDTTHMQQHATHLYVFCIAIRCLLRMEEGGVHGCGPWYCAKDLESEWNCFRTSLFNEHDPQVRFVLACDELWTIPLARGEKYRQVLNAELER